MKKVYIWGTGKYLKVVYGAINKDLCSVEGIIDSDETKQGKFLFADLCAESPAVLLYGKFDYILISAKNYQPILADCKGLGIADDKILIFWKNQKDLYSIIDEKSKKIIELEEELQICKWKLDSLPYELGVKQGPKIKSSEELLQYIIQKKVSLCRFGDGEFEIMRELERPWFQNVDLELSRRLKTVLHSDHRNIAIAIANNFGSLDCYTEKAANAIRQYLYGGTRKEVMEFFENDRFYFDAYVSRPYLMYRDKNNAKIIFDLLKKIWENRNLLIVEGENSKMGVGNDLMMNTKRIRRVICPAQNAFSQYSKILNTVQNLVSEDELVIVSLGPTATVLAYDLGISGIQTLDVGQIDNEYEWFIRNAEDRVEIPGKCVAELSWCHQPNAVIADNSYEEQIVGRIASD